MNHLLKMEKGYQCANSPNIHGDWTSPIPLRNLPRLPIKLIKKITVPVVCVPPQAPVRMTRLPDSSYWSVTWHKILIQIGCATVTLHVLQVTVVTLVTLVTIYHHQTHYATDSSIVQLPPSQHCIYKPYLESCYSFQVLSETPQQLESLSCECLQTSTQTQRKSSTLISPAPQVSNISLLSDSENIKLVFCAVKDTIMQAALAEFGMN